MRINKFLKIVFVMILLALIIFTFCQTVQGWTPDWTQFDTSDSGNTGDTVAKIVGGIINIVSIIATGIAIIMLIVMGITYVSEGPTGKAEAKKGISSYITGAIILFATSGILKLLQYFIDGNINNI